MPKARTSARTVVEPVTISPVSEAPIVKNIKWGDIDPTDLNFSADQKETLDELDSFLGDVLAMEIIAGSKPVEKPKSIRMSAKYLRDAKRFLIDSSPKITVADAAKHPVISGELTLLLI